MPLQKVSAVVGVAKQASAGTIASNSSYVHGLTGGAPISVAPNVTPLEVTVAKRAAFNVYRDDVVNGGEIQSFSYLRSLGLWLLGAMGTDTVTGTNPYVHTYTTGDALPYLSVFTRGIDNTISAIRDCKVDELTLKWDGSRPVELTTKVLGTVFSYPATFVPATVNVSSISVVSTTATYTTATAHGLAVNDPVTIVGTTSTANSGVFTVASIPTGTTFTITNASAQTQASTGGTVQKVGDETGSESYLTPLGGTFSIDVIGSSVATARVIGGELTIKNNVSAIHPSATVEAGDVWEGIQEHSLKLTIVPDNLSDFRKTVTGGAAGTASATTQPVGSVSLTFRENNGTGQLVVTGSKVAFMTAFPDADPKGGAVEIELVGMPVMPTNGTAPLVYALTNGQATY